MTTNKKAAGPGRGETASKTHYITNHSPVDNLLSRLDRVKRTGPSTWMASCPTRDDKRPSMTIRELDDGRVLIHDFGGDSPAEILAALGMEFSDLFPPRPHGVGKPERRPFPAADVLRTLSFEGTILAIAGRGLLSGRAWSEEDQARLVLAVGRINDGLTLAGVTP